MYDTGCILHRFLGRHEDPREETVMEHMDAEGTLPHVVSFLCSSRETAASGGAVQDKGTTQL